MAPIAWQRDELPFYASEQGGAWDSWTGEQHSPLSTRLLMVPKSENKAGKPLLTVPRTDAVENPGNKTFYVC